MIDFDYDKYLLAGKILAEVRDKTKKLIQPNISLLEIAQKIESLIQEQGGQIAFPVNISINEIAAHYTPTPNDTTVFKENDIIKIDMGVHIDGYIADSAYTICFDPDKKDMVSVINHARDEAVKLATPGRPVKEISETIESVITNADYKPISNLTGHKLERYKLHTGFTIPNIKTDTKAILQENDVIAIEPFLTNGGGAIKEISDCCIYMFENQKKIRSQTARQVLSYAQHKVNGLPFAKRWIKQPQGIILDRALQELISIGAIYKYNVLKEINNGLVTQAEHTVIVKDKPIITTK
ncbi:MAG: type II methionyl aminopeptidase [Candidatus Aenigmarchaeota archaeon]|nr:type II methionyl aminopeptidase [Candidatus Aenigmarchaeota archaeon]